MSDPTQAVFLSYAREDTDAARRIADALRSQGIEVWFDQNELRGGDAWDQKIRKQINDCTLFLPIISRHTQGRSKGYFRLEWKLAVEQTHLMLEGVPFLAPIVIDATPEAGAAVPAEFMRVQWTRLPGALPTPQFVEQVQRLLSRQSESLVAGVADPGLSAKGLATADPASPRPATVAQPVGRAPLRQAQDPWLRARPVWIGGVAAAALLGVFGWMLTQRKTDGPFISEPAAKPPLDLSTIPSAVLSSVGLAKGEGLAKGDKSIAVLPFANLSTDKENEFFADGMHDELLAALAKIGALKVISRTSVLAYRDPAKRNLKQIAAELGVAHVLEGSVSRAGSNVRIIVQLIDAATDHHRWANTYNIKAVTDVFQVQAEISAQIAQALAATISPELKLALAKKLTSNPAAYDFYLHARRWREMSRGAGGLNSVAKWEELIVLPLEQAVALDPKFAAAYAELGQVHGYLYWFPQFDPTPARLAKAKAAIDTALRLEPALPVAHLALGSYYYIGFLDYARATEEYAIALAAMPGDADVLLNLAVTQRRQGRWAEATANLERAFAVNPRNQDIVQTWVQCLMAQRFYTRAERAAEQALAVDSTNTRSLNLKASARFARDGDRARYHSALDGIPRAPGTDPRGKRFARAFEVGRYAEAVRTYEEAPWVVDPASRFVRLRYFYAATAGGDREKVRGRALAAIAETKDSAEERRDEWVRVADLAILNAYAGLPDEARRLAARTLELMPVKRDAYDGPRALYQSAQVYLVLGDRDRALALLDQAMSVPSGLTANQILHTEPWWAPLHHDPRFKAALAKAAPRE